MCCGSKPDGYPEDRFRWPDQVAAASELLTSAFKVAYAIATSPVERKNAMTAIIAAWIRKFHR